jgi:hypothetical protein
MDSSAFEGMGWSDVELESLAWDEGGRDLVLRVRGPGADAARRTIICQWAEGLEVRLAFPQGRGGYPLTWAARLTRLPDGRCSLHFDFAHAGEIRLLCTDVEVKAA